MENVSNARTGEIVSELSRSEVFDVLGEKRRRYVLYYLDGRDEPQPLARLVDQVAAWENDTTEEHRSRVCASIHHAHLPKLEDVGVVAYDRGTETVELSEASDELQPHLDVAAGRELP